MTFFLAAFFATFLPPSSLPFLLAVFFFAAFFAAFLTGLVSGSDFIFGFSSPVAEVFGSLLSSWRLS